MYLTKRWNYNILLNTNNVICNFKVSLLKLFLSDMIYVGPVHTVSGLFFLADLITSRPHVSGR